MCCSYPEEAPLMLETYIALLRGINVGGRNRLQMKKLVGIAEDLGLREASTYIQSGNLVFRCERGASSERLGSALSEAIDAECAFSPRVQVLRLAELQSAMDGNPFPEAEDEPKTLHLNFLAAPAKNSDLEAVAAVAKENERYVLTDRVFYLHAPDGIGRSDLAKRLERLLGVSATGRNWRTLCKVRELAEE